MQQLCITKDVINTFCEIEITYKAKVKASQRPKMIATKDVFDYLLKIWDMDNIERKETFIILLLNRANRVLGWHRVSEGGMSGTIVDCKMVFQAALKANACSIILAHNHPSGSPTPSESDKQLTSKLREAGNLLDIMVLDHVVITLEDYFSFADNGLL